MHVDSMPFKFACMAEGFLTSTRNQEGKHCLAAHGIRMCKLQVGAGVIGLYIAHELLQQTKLSVALIDRQQPCAGATGAGEWGLAAPPAPTQAGLSLRHGV